MYVVVMLTMACMTVALTRLYAAVTRHLTASCGAVQILPHVKGKQLSATTLLQLLSTDT